MRPIVNPYVSGHYHPHTQSASHHYTMVTKSGGHCQPLRLPLTNSLNLYIVLPLSTHSRFIKIIALSSIRINKNIIHLLTGSIAQLYYEPYYTTQ